MRGSIATLDAPTNMTPDLWAALARIAALIADGQLREDLFRRLDVIHLSTPPLRERKQDVPALVDHFLDRVCQQGDRGLRTITDEAMAALVGYSWPGDVRELQDVVERMVGGARSQVIGIEDVPLDIRGRRTGDDLYDAMVVNHESFWTTVYPLLINRQITGPQVREIVRRGLVAVGGKYTEVARLFNVPMPDDYKKFLNFLDHFNCKPSFKAFRRGHLTGQHVGQRTTGAVEDARDDVTDETGCGRGLRPLTRAAEQSEQGIRRSVSGRVPVGQPHTIASQRETGMLRAIRRM
jgi:hypothetical protein